MHDFTSGWRRELSVSRAEIDRQHREIVAQACALQTAITGQRPTSELDAILASLLDTTRSHFTAEEGLMLASGYPEFDEHRNEHRRLLDHLGSVRTSLSEGHTQASDSLASLIRILTEQHIVFSDKRLAAFLNEAGFPSV